MPHQYIFGAVKKILDSKNKDIIDEGSYLALVELYRRGDIDIFSVPESLREVIRIDDFVTIDVVTRELVNIIRNDTRIQIENLYKAIDQKFAEANKPKPSPLTY